MQMCQNLFNNGCTPTFLPVIQQNRTLSDAEMPRPKICHTRNISKSFGVGEQEAARGKGFLDEQKCDNDKIKKKKKKKQWENQ